MRAVLISEKLHRIAHAQPYVLPAVHPEVEAWLKRAGVPIAGDPFFKFNLIDMDHELEVEVGTGSNGAEIVVRASQWVCRPAHPSVSRCAPDQR